MDETIPPGTVHALYRVTGLKGARRAEPTAPTLVRFAAGGGQDASGTRAA